MSTSFLLYIISSFLSSFFLANHAIEIVLTVPDITAQKFVTDLQLFLVFLQTLRLLVPVIDFDVDKGVPLHYWYLLWGYCLTFVVMVFIPLAGEREYGR